MMRKSKNIIAIFVAIIIALSSFTIVFIPGPAPVYAQTIEEKLEQVHQEQKEIDEKIKKTKEAEKQYQTEVSQVEQELLGALSDLDELNSRLADAKSEFDRTTIEMVLKEEELKKIEEELEGSVATLNNRIAAIYKNGKGNILEVLLKAEDFLDFISRLKLMNLFAEQDTQNILLIKEKRDATIGIKKSIIDLREKQGEYKERVKKLVAEAEQKTGEIEGIYGEKKSLLSKTTANKNAFIRMEKELEIKEAELVRILESYKYGSAPSGKFIWPVAGTVTSRYGYRIHPIFGVRRFHSGIDIAAPYGTPVKAADGGQIVQAGYFGGYGYSIMVYHGGGFATWYAHLSSINVSVGQFVERGQVIGLLGSTGWSTGPHLHFEVRINGNHTDPMGYL